MEKNIFKVKKGDFTSRVYVKCLDGKDRVIFINHKENIMYYCGFKNGKEHGRSFDLKPKKMPKWINQTIYNEVIRSVSKKATKKQTGDTDFNKIKAELTKAFRVR